jgi:predicted transcriptional regulator
MEKLTKAEEEVMLIIWDLGEATVREVLEKLNDPDIAYTTVGSILRILDNKGFVAHRAIGNTYLYSPAVEKSDYTRYSLKGFLNKYFEGSFTNLASFFATENDMSMRELRDMMQEVKDDLREERRTERNEK